MIEIEEPRSHFADIGEGIDARVVPAKMLRPAIGAWVEKANQNAGARVHRTEVGALVSIAVETGEGEIFGCGLATVFGAEDVIDFAAVINVALVDEAILADLPGAFRDEAAQRPSDLTRHEPATVARALSPDS